MDIDRFMNTNAQTDKVLKNTKGVQTIMTDIMTAVSAVHIKGSIESLEHIISTLRNMHRHQSNSEHIISTLRDMHRHQSNSEHIISTLRDMHRHQSNSEHSIKIKEKQACIPVCQSAVRK